MYPVVEKSMNITYYLANYISLFGTKSMCQLYIVSKQENIQKVGVTSHYMIGHILHIYMTKQSDISRP